MIHKMRFQLTGTSRFCGIKYLVSFLFLRVNVAIAIILSSGCAGQPGLSSLSQTMHTVRSSEWVDRSVKLMDTNGTTSIVVAKCATFEMRRDGNWVRHPAMGVRTNIPIAVIFSPNSKRYWVGHNAPDATERAGVFLDDGQQIYGLSGDADVLQWYKSIVPASQNLRSLEQVETAFCDAALTFERPPFLKREETRLGLTVHLTTPLIIAPVRSESLSRIESIEIHDGILQLQVIGAINENSAVVKIDTVTHKVIERSENVKVWNSLRATDGGITR